MLLSARYSRQQCAVCASEGGRCVAVDFLTQQYQIIKMLLVDESRHPQPGGLIKKSVGDTDQKELSPLERAFRALRALIRASEHIQSVHTHH